MSETTQDRPLILVADDDSFMLATIVHYLEHAGFPVLEAEDGQEAVELFHARQPELVLLDANRPVMDGFEACEIINQADKNGDVPVIMVTALDDDDSINRAFDAGAEEYITKPINWTVLRRRIDLLTEQKRNQRAIRERDLEIRRHRDQLAYERAFIEEIISRMRTSKRFDDRHLRTLQSPLEKTAGDILLATFRPDGTQHVLLGDFTGHGLPAAIGGPIVSDIFYAMSAKNLSMEEIVAEVNQRLLLKMPVSMFMAGLFMSLDPARGRLEVWNCSMPDLLLVRGDHLVERVASDYFARGILELQAETGSSLTVHPGDRIYAYSDGLVEEKNAEGQLFGTDRLADGIMGLLAKQEPLDRLIDIIDDYRCGTSQSDDVTMVEITC